MLTITLPVLPAETPAKLFHRLAFEAFHPSQPHYQRIEFNLRDRASINLILTQGITVLASIGAAYIFASWSNDYYDNPNPDQRSWIAEKDRVPMSHTSFYSSFLVNTATSMYCVSVVLNQIMQARKKQVNDINPARKLITIYDQSLKVRIINRLGLGCQIILTIGAFVVGLGNLRGITFTFNDCLKLVSCVINAPIAWVSLLQYKDLSIFDRLRYSSNPAQMHSNQIARALQALIIEQRIKAENQGIEVCKKIHDRLTLTALNKDEFLRQQLRVLNDPDLPIYLNHLIINVATFAAQKNNTQFEKAQIRLLFAILTTMGSNIADPSHNLESSPLLPSAPVSKRELIKNIILKWGIYCGIICILSGLGYPAGAAIGMKNIWNGLNLPGGDVVSYITFIITLLSSSGLALTSGLATFDILEALFKDLCIALFVKVPNLCGFRGLSSLGTEWHTTRSLDYHLLILDSTCHFPMLWLLTNLVLFVASCFTWTSNVYVNETSIVPFFQHMGFESAASIAFFTFVKDVLDYAAVLGAIAVNYYFSSLFAINALVTLLYFSNLNARDEVKRQVRETVVGQVKQICDAVGNMNPPCVASLVDETNSFLNPNIIKALPQKSIRFFREGDAIVQPLAAAPATQSEFNI